MQSKHLALLLAMVPDLAPFRTVLLEDDKTEKEILKEVKKNQAILTEILEILKKQ